MSINLKAPAYYVNQSGSLINIVIVGISAIVALACAVQIYFIFNYERDYLAGAIGLIHSDSSGISLLKFYIITGAIAFSIASHKYIKLVAAGLAIYALIGMYGTQFYIKSQQNFSINNLPRVTDAPLPTKPPADTTTTTNESRTINQKYIKTTTPLTKDEKDWCATHSNKTELSKINCSTGYIWRTS